MSSAPGTQRPPILLTGATGYVGGRLRRVSRLIRRRRP
jgi:thioester reductase-like protein